MSQDPQNPPISLPIDRLVEPSVMDYLSGFGAPEFDSARWAHAEIVQNLQRARVSLSPPEGGQIEVPRAVEALQQACRALGVIGQEALSHLPEAASRLLAECLPPDVPLALEAIDALEAHLAALAGGQAQPVLDLLPLYRRLREACGEAVRASDLFYPDLNVRPAALQYAGLDLPDALAAQQARFEHRCFERGMRDWLREPGQAGLADMRRAVAAIERAQRLPAARAFWWAATALMDALIDGGLANTPELRQLIGAIERQMRHLLVGMARVPDALMREVLFHVAIAHCAASQVLAVREAYKLADLLPAGQTPWGTPASTEPDVLTRLTQAWARVQAGEAAALESCRAALAPVADGATNMELARLLSVQKEALEWLAAQGAPTASPLTQEFANALPVLGRALAAPGQNDPELQRQSELLAARLAEVQFDAPEAAPLAPQPTAPARVLEATEHAALAQVAQARFEQIEAGLQACLNEPQMRALDTLAAPMAALDNTLAQLGDTPARGVLEACVEGVRTLTEMGAEAQEAVFPLLIRDLTALGERIAALAAPPDAEALAAARNVVVLSAPALLPAEAPPVAASAAEIPEPAREPAAEPDVPQLHAALAQVQRLARALSEREAPEPALAQVLTTAVDELQALQRAVLAKTGCAQTVLAPAAPALQGLAFELLLPRLQAALAQAARARGVAATFTLHGGQTELPPALFDPLGGVLEAALGQIAAAATRPVFGQAQLDLVMKVGVAGGDYAIDINPVPATLASSLEALNPAARLPGARVGWEAGGLQLTFAGAVASLPTALLSAGGRRAAIPVQFLMLILTLEGAALDHARAAGRLVWQGQAFPLRELADLLELPRAAVARADVVLLAAGERRLALACEGPITFEDVAVKPLIAGLARVPGVLGASLLGEDEVVLLLDPLTLAEHKAAPEAESVPPTAPEAASAPERRAAPAPVRVLLVDDPAQGPGLAHTMLESAGFQVQVASAGDTALAALQSAPFAAVMIDADLPGLDALDLARRLRAAAQSALPMVLLSTRLHPAQRESAAQAGITHHLAKPYQGAELVAVFEAALREKTRAGAKVL